MRKQRRLLRENDMVVTGPRGEESTSTRNTSSQTERDLRWRVSLSRRDGVETREL